MDDLIIETEYGRIFSKTAGKQDNPLVLGLHGWSQRNGWHVWEPLIRPLADAGFWVVSVDIPGWGRSIPADPAPMTKERAVAVVLAILDELDVEQANLMGQSWGGGIALNVGLDYPQRIDKLILTAPAFKRNERLSTLRPPVLIAWAKDDPVIPYSFGIEYLGLIPIAQLEAYATGGHSAAQNNADDFAPKAIEFLRRQYDEFERK